MSDVREAAEQELVSAGMASGMEDFLGSSLSTSFSIPPPPPKIKPQPAIEPTIQDSPETEQVAEELEDWKPEYEARLAKWQAEAAEARAKAEATRKRIEDEHEAEKKAIKDKELAEKKEKLARESEKNKAELLRKELETEVEGARKKGKRGDLGGQERDKKVKEAWEMVKGAPETEGREVVTDGRGVTAGDVAAGQQKPPIRETMYDPTTSTEPLPPSMQTPSPTPSYPAQTESATLSRHSATSQAWEHVSAESPSSAEDLSPPQTASNSGLETSEIISLPQSSHPVGQSLTNPVPKDITPSGLSLEDLPTTSTGRGKHSQPDKKNTNTPPTQPPSLTLSLFTLPSHLSFSRVLAVVGINLVLPFINGVMLGFGEIFARESVKFGKLWWKGERRLWGSAGWGGAERQGQGREFAGGRGVAGVGLSGSGGFP